MIPYEEREKLRFVDLVARISHVPFKGTVKVLVAAASVLDELGERGAAARIRHNLRINTRPEDSHSFYASPDAPDIEACNRAYDYLVEEYGEDHVRQMIQMDG